MYKLHVDRFCPRDLNHLILIKLVVIKFAVLCALQRKEFKVTKKTSIITIGCHNTCPVLQ